MPLKLLISCFVSNNSGATAIEYALIAALISVGCIIGLVVAGDSVQGLFEFIAEALTSAFAS